MIDNVATHPTPEGLMLTLVPAGLIPRCSAWLIDFAIRLVVFLIVYLIGSIFGETGYGLIAIGFFLIYWGYSVFFEVYRDGMTPGKKSQGIYVCHDDGTPITLQASLIRNLLRVADFLPVGFMAGILAMMFNRQSQRLGDMVAGTLVVYREQQGMAKLYQSIYGAVSEGDNIQTASAAYLSPDQAGEASRLAAFDAASPLFFYPLRLNEQQVMLSFMERVPFLSIARQQEIASVLLPLVTVSAPHDGVSSAQALATQEACRLAVLERARHIQGKI